jgi:hypothetical protein
VKQPTKSICKGKATVNRDAKLVNAAKVDTGIVSVKRLRTQQLEQTELKKVRKVSDTVRRT